MNSWFRSRKLIKYFTPPAFVDTARFVSRFIRQYTCVNKELLAKNRVFRGCHKGKRCFVIGNGPSVANQNLGMLGNEITLVMNGFFKHPVVNQWQPTYYLLADQLYFDRSEPSNQFFLDLRARINKTTLLVPLNSYEAIQDLGLYPLDHTLFVKFNGALANGAYGWPDFTRLTPGVQSVSQFALMAAMFMGCSPIYLLGFDHDWLAHRGQDRHFYEGQTLIDHPATFSADLSKFSYKNDAQNIVYLWNGYEALRDAAITMGVQILNATGGGFLDVFDRVRFEDILEIPGP